MQTPKVSVIVPVLNPHPEYFRQAIASILNQSFGDWELIVVEAPSARSAALALAEWNDPRLRHILCDQPTTLVDQRNRGLAEARAPLLALLDADDIAEPQRLAEQVSVMDAEPELAVLGSQLSIIDAEGNKVAHRDYPLAHEDIVRAMRLYNPVAQPSVMVRRQALVEMGGYTYRTFPVEDFELWCRMAVGGRRFANSASRLLRYRIHGGAMKATRLRAVLRGTMDVKIRYWGSQLGLRERARLWGERALLCLPPALVWRMFTRTAYHREAGTTSS